MKSNIALALIASAALWLGPSPRAADAAPFGTPHTFEAVDSVAVTDDLYKLIVEGVLVGEDTVTELSFRVNRMEVLERCDRLAMLAIARPGQYLFEVYTTSPASRIAQACRLVRRTP